MATTRDINKPGKLNQIVQNFFVKAAQIVVHSRVSVTPAYVKGSNNPKINKWFNIELEEPDSFKEDLRVWRGIDVGGGGGVGGGSGGVNSIPPLVVETFLNLRSLNDQQTLLLVDSNGKSFNVLKGVKKSEVVLERWVIDIVSNGGGSGSGGGGGGGSGSGSSSGLSDDGLLLDVPIVYKKLIIIFRSLYTYVHLMPSWGLRKKISKAKLNINSMGVGCRIINGSQPISSKGRIGLTKNILNEDGGDNHLDTFHFSTVSTPIGDLRISVSFRTNVNFRVGDSEALLSNHFLSMDQRTHIVGSGGIASSVESGGGGRRGSNVGKVGGGVGGGVQGHGYNHNHNHGQTSSGSISGSGSGSASAGSGSSSANTGNAIISGSSSSGVGGLGGLSREREQERDRNHNHNHHDHDRESTTPTSAHPSPTPGPYSSSPHPKPSVSFIQPFKSPTTVSSGFDQQQQSSPRKSSVGRIPSNSSLAALRIPKRNPSTASANSINSISSSYARTGTTVGLGTNIPSSVGSNIGEVSSSYSSGSSIPKYSSSFGSRSQWPRSGSISSTNTTRQRPQSFLGDPSSLGSNSSSILDPGSGIYLPSNDLGDFVKMVDSVHRPFTSNSPDNDPTASNPLARFQVLKDNHKALSESLQSSVYLPKEESKPILHINPNPNPPNPYDMNLSTSSSPISKGLLSHTPVRPSRLSEELTIEDSGRRSRQSMKSSTSALTSVSEPPPPLSQLTRKSSSRSRTRGSSFYANEPSYTSTSPLDIPQSPISTRLTRRESTSLSNQRTLDSDDLHTQVDLESHHHSLNREGGMAMVNTSSTAARRRSSFYLGDEAAYRAIQPTTSQPIRPNIPPLDDDDLLFTMSDMHITSPKQEDEPRFGPRWP